MSSKQSKEDKQAATSAWWRDIRYWHGLSPEQRKTEFTAINDDLMGIVRTSEGVMDVPQFIVKHWPDAVDVKREGKCHVCERDSLYSFTQEEFRQPEYRNNRFYEQCGYCCVRCGWSNAGTREI